jgi:hypothetical protein
MRSQEKLRRREFLTRTGGGLGFLALTAHLDSVAVDA